MTDPHKHPTMLSRDDVFMAVWEVKKVIDETTADDRAKIAILLGAAMGCLSSSNFTNRKELEREANTLHEKVIAAEIDLAASSNSTD